MTPAAGAGPANVVVVHETDGRRYLEALVHLHTQGEIASLDFVSASVLWRAVHLMIRERRGLKASVAVSWRTIQEQLKLPMLRDRTIVLAVAPWDLRLLFFTWLLRRNRIIYNTSWPWWALDRGPRQYGPLLTAWSRRQWLRRLAAPNVALTAVTSAAAAAIGEQVPGKPVTIIPHVAGDAFTQVQVRYGRPFRLLYVGDLIEKKGLRLFQPLLAALEGLPVELDIVGDGPLRGVAEELVQGGRCRWHGRVRDRRALAGIVGTCHAFVSPALRTPKWEELFGMSIVEAMAAGLPPIVSDHVGPRSLITSGVNGVLVPEGDIAAIAGQIRIFLAQPDVWQAMSAEARLRAADFSLRGVSERWREVLDLPVPPIATPARSTANPGGAAYAAAAHQKEQAV